MTERPLFFRVRKKDGSDIQCPECDARMEEVMLSAMMSSAGEHIFKAVCEFCASVFRVRNGRDF